MRKGVLLIGLVLLTVTATVIWFSCTDDTSVESKNLEEVNMGGTNPGPTGEVLPVTISGDYSTVYGHDGKSIAPVITELQDIRVEMQHDPHITYGMGIRIDGSMNVEIKVSDQAHSSPANPPPANQVALKSLNSDVLPVEITGDEIRVYDVRGREISPTITELQDITVMVAFHPNQGVHSMGIRIDGSMMIRVDILE